MARSEPRNSPHVLIIRDGWGHNPNPHHREFNAIELAETPTADRLMAEFPSTLIRTSGEDVGLIDGQTSNSEVGHQNIGAGRIVYQNSMRITRAVRSGRFFENEALIEAVVAAKEEGKAVHLMGIASNAGVHGVLNHMYACLELCKRLDHERVLVHLFTDGRDTGPFSGIELIDEVERMMAELREGRIASVIGRYWAMDRDNRWERIEKAYRCLTGLGMDPNGMPICSTASEAVQRYYDSPVNDSMRGDEFIQPTMIGFDFKDALSRRITRKDTVIFYNYRGDRPRELIRAFVLNDFEKEVPPSPDSGRRGFERGPRLDLNFVTLAEYDTELNPYVNVAFRRPEALPVITGEYVAQLGLRQFRCAETEKYPHVTFFFNDYREEAFPDEHRGLVQSPQVATYDQQPEMSAEAVCATVLDRLAAEDCEDLIVVNFANPDMVGHTGKLDAAVRAVQKTDECVGRVVDATLARGGSLIVTADHGNAEQMWDPIVETPHTSHTTYDVPLIIVGEEFAERSLREGGRLADVVPTSLDMLRLPKPDEMDGSSLIV